MLERLRQSPSDEDWRQLVDLYTPFIRRWLHDPTLAADAEDLLQDVLTTIVRSLPEFHRQREGSLRAWLRLVTVNRVKNWRRDRLNRAVATGGSDHLERLHQLADADSELSRQWNREHDHYVLRQLVATLEPEFAPDTWSAFAMQMLERRTASEVAEELGKSVNAVLLAKSRVLARLREEAVGLVD